ncbi:CxxxxCH/CxxCH domain-containing protein [Geobacter pelophilus]|uniref:CxxxxCH/CxxCH domain-containing protein n=1 Tax=Geoanaerobacter pelophilus TaxID=60036 RepID=A0AAW4LC35_9BACT|nr:CxxxxCH/CxxCH domain-containing protein [Geoanaerobacter pelophilus]MBT0665961.1 CxxxxCH/CxxCH domain-containing protein [Geoanaerobacter pelophilus]
MREVSTRVSFLYTLIVFVGTCLLFPTLGQAIECNECHGTKVPVDFRPLDDAYRNMTTGGFQGNHRTHTSKIDTKQQCEFCHSGSSSYNQGHRNGKINISKNINNSRQRAIYNNVTSPWAQTATPVYGTCTNVNCHFENETPQWGSNPFVVPNDCSGCHGFPPYGGNTGAEGSHLATGHMMGGDIDSCGHCHPRHTGFTHATSVRRSLLVTPRDPTSIAAGYYDGPTNDYLPLQDNQFGKCNNIYCHSNGSSLATGTIAANASPVWGGASLNCGSCHSYPPDYANGAPKANSHAKHSVYGFSCSRCHYSTTSDNVTIRNWRKHISKFYNISSQEERLTYSFAANGGNCSNFYCHSNGTSKSTGVVQANTVKWGSTLTCSSCHANPPAYLTGSPKANSHGAHSGYSCNKCHVDTTNDGVTISNPAKHDNGSYDVTAGNGASFNYVYSAAGGSCSNNACHNDGTSVSTGVPSSLPAQWGTSLGCSGCHGLPPEYVNGSVKSNSHIGKHSAYMCNSCHYATSSDGVSVTNSTNHANGQYNVSSAVGMFTYSYAASGGTCSNVQCHANPTGYRKWGAKECDACHGAPPDTPAHRTHFSGSAQQASYTSVKTAQDYSANATGYIFNCANCHPMDINKHGNGILEVELYNPNAPQGSIKSLQSGATYKKGNRYYLDSRGFAYTNGTCSNVYCHSYSDWKTPGVENCMSNYSTCDKAAVASLVQTREYRSVTWNGSLPKNCTGCHANGPRTRSETNYGSTGNNHSWINNDYYEEGHFGKYYFTTDPISCTFCHNGTVTQLNNWSRPVIADPYSYYPTASEPYFTTMSSVPIANFSKHVNGKADVIFDKDKTFTVNFPGGYSTPPKTTFYKMSTSTYSAETKSCSNVACHLGQSTVKWGTPYKAYKYNIGEDYGCRKCHDSNHPYVSF